MTVSENEEAIYKQLNKNRLKLYATLSKKINSDTDNYFYINDGISLYYPDLENLNEFTFWNPDPQRPCPCPQFRNEGDGVVSFLGAVFKTGWENTEQWEMVADIKFGRLYKTGLILLTDANNPFPKNGWYSEASGRWGISAWERFIGTPYTLDGDPHYEITYEGNSQKFTQYFSDWANNVWHSLHMKKVSSTRLIVWLDDNENDRIIYDWEELSDVEQVTFGATMNHNTSDYGICGGSFPLIRLYVRDLYVFYPSLPANRLTALCEDTKKIKCSTNNSATIPPTPNLVSGNTLAINEFNIHNKIQYCNNVLRYTLRKCGIEFNDSYDNNGNYTGINLMQELIRYINEIKSPASIIINDMYSAYVNPIQLSGDKSIVQANETYNLIAEVVDKGAGISVDFIQKNKKIIEDNAVTSDNNSGYWAYNTTYVSQSVDATGTAVTNSDTLDRVYTLRKTTSGSQYEVFSPLCSFEFDLISVTGTVQIQERIGSIQKSYTLSETGHYKIVNDENYINIYCNNVLKNRLKNTMTDLHQIRFGLFGVGSFTYKNFKVFDEELLATETTNLNGIAVCEVTGDGSGLDKYYAKSENFKSNELSVIDATFIDYGVTDRKNSNWENYEDRMTITVDANGTKLDGISNYNSYYLANANNKFIFSDYVCEFDIVTGEGSPRWYHQSVSSGNENVFFFNNYVSSACHIKIEVLNGVATLYKDNVLKTTFNLTVPAPYELGFRLPNTSQSNHNITYKNFIIYPFKGKEPPE